MSKPRLWLLAGGLLLLVVALTIPFAIQQAVPASAEEEVCSDEVNLFTLSSDKESDGAFGPAVAEGSQDEVLAELHDRRCVDPLLVAAHASAWELISADEAVINQFALDIATDPVAWRSTIEQLEALEAESSIDFVTAPKGVKTQFMTPTADGWATIHYGRSGFDGSVIRFTNPSGTTVQLRLECGFQPVWSGEPPEPPAPCPPGQVPNDNGVCVVPKSSDPADYEYPEGKPPVPEVTTPAETTPPAVETTTTGGRGVVDTPTNPPSSETGVTAPGATPAPTTAEPLPPNEGGDSVNANEVTGW